MDLMTKAIKTSLLIMLNEVESCLDELKRDPDIKGWAVNWGDLHCSRAEYVISTDWVEGYPVIEARVYVSEAAPNSLDLIEHIRALLPSHLEKIEIITEW